MSEQNGTTQNPTPKQEVCTMRIMFPVTSVEQAIDIKKQITSMLSEISEAQIQFSLITAPKMDALNASRIR